jgi:hypothetical protein
VKGVALESVSRACIFFGKRMQNLERLKRLLAVVGIRGQENFELGFIRGLSEILYDVGLGEFSLTLWLSRRFHNCVYIVKEIALRTSDGHWSETLVVWDEAKEGDTTAC